jgi:methylisocitrate lyase
MGELYAELRAKGTAEAILGRMQTRAELYETIGYSEYESLDASVAASVVPPDLRGLR